MRYDPPIHHGNGRLFLAFAFIGLALFPLAVDDAYLQHLIVLAFIYAIVAASWDLSLGYGGLFNFAHVALFATGLYTYAILTKTLGVSPWLALPAGGLTAVVVAALIALPVLRLDGIYVILVTIAVSQLLYQLVVSQSDVTGGTSGMVTLPALSIGDYRFVRDGKIGYYYAGLALLVAACAFLYAVTRSRLGRAMVALRDQKYFAVARGVSEARTRLLTLMASALFTGIAGAFFGAYVRVASPDVFGLGFLTLILSILLVGGGATLWGPVMAAFVLPLLSEAIADLGPWREVLIGILIILVVVFYPGGLWAAIQELREVIDVRRTAFLAWRNRRRGQAAREARLSAREVMVPTPHGRIAVSDSGGDLPALLFIHGNSACKEAFFRQAAAYRGRYRVVAFDLPGHGVSENGDPERSYNVVAYAEVAEAVLRARGVARPVVFGWSLGGYVALELAARGRATVRGLAICGTAPLTVVPDDFGSGYDAGPHLILAGKQYFSAAEARDYAGSATAPLSADSRFLHANLPRTDGRARSYMITKLTVVNWPRQRRMLRSGQLPFIVINGADDPFLNHDYIARLAAADGWPLVTIPGGRHAPFFNTPDAFHAAFDGFLSTVDAGSSRTSADIAV